MLAVAGAMSPRRGRQRFSPGLEEDYIFEGEDGNYYLDCLSAATTCSTAAMAATLLIGRPAATSRAGGRRDRHGGSATSACNGGANILPAPSAGMVLIWAGWCRWLRLRKQVRQQPEGAERHRGLQPLPRANGSTWRGVDATSRRRRPGVRVHRRGPVHPRRRAPLLPAERRHVRRGATPPTHSGGGLVFGARPPVRRRSATSSSSRRHADGLLSDPCWPL